MAKWKKPQPIEFIEQATRNYSFPNWQSGNEESIYYNLNLPEFFKCSYIAPPQEFSKLERAIDPSLLDLTFTAHDGTTTPPLKEYLVGKRQVQAMMMAHKGKVVFEIYPGMNPTDIHIWMSASKPTVGLLVAMLADEGKIDLDKPVPTYVPEIRGSAWEQATVRNVMNMSSGLDIEETIENLLNPQSWIANWFTAGFELNKGDFREMSKNAKPLPGEPAGAHFRYSGANTQTLVLATQYVSGKRWQTLWNERVWSKIGAKNAFITGLAQDGTPLCAGMHNTTPEDLLRFTLLYTPSWHVVSDEQIISDRLLKSIQTMGNPEPTRARRKSNTAATGSARPLPTTPPSGTMSSATAPCSSTATWARASMSTRPAISVACTSVSRPTRTKSRASIIRRVIFEPPRSYLPESS